MRAMNFSCCIAKDRCIHLSHVFVKRPCKARGTSEEERISAEQDICITKFVSCWCDFKYMVKIKHLKQNHINFEKACGREL